MSEDSQPRMPVFSLRGLFSLTLTVATAMFLLQFVIKNPRAIPPFVIVGWFISILIAPSLLSRMKTPRSRLSWGCAYVMISPILFAMLAAALILLAGLYATPELLWSL